MINKRKVIITITSILILIIIILVMLVLFFKNAIFKLGGNVSLDTKNYLTAVEVKSDVNFILLFNKQEMVSNIIYLNNKSVTNLYNKQIEGKNIDKAIELIVSNIKDNLTDIELVNYGNQDIFDKVVEQINKQFIIFAINKEIKITNSSLKDKLKELKLSVKSRQEDNIKQLYYYSLETINNSNILEKETIELTEKDFDEYALNIYNKLLTYATGISYQEKNDFNGINITTINASKDYTEEFYATNNSWYYIDNYKVYAYINFNYNNKNYDYCFLGNIDYNKNICQ